MNAGKAVFAQIMEFVPWTSFARTVHGDSGNAGACPLSCAEQFRVVGFRSAVKRTTLADVNESRDGLTGSGLAAVLIRRDRKPGSGDCLGIDLDNTVRALDASTIDLCLSRFEWASFRSTKAAIKLHTLLDLGRCQPRLYPHQRRQAARPERAGHAGHAGYAGYAELRVRGGLRDGSRPCRLRAAPCAAPGRRLLRHQRSAISGRCSTAAARPGSIPSI